MKLYTFEYKFIEESDNWPNDFTGIAECDISSINWFKDGLRHRLDGPAIETNDGDKAYFICGKYIVKESFEFLTSIMKLKRLL